MDYSHDIPQEVESSMGKRNLDDIPVIMMQCPKCGNEEEDFDGLGMLCCPKCDYCIHPNNDGDDICGYCGESIIEDLEQLADHKEKGKPWRY